jgi:transposase
MFQLHGACANGAVIFRKKLRRVQRLAFMSQHPACLVAMEACATAHCWGREIEVFGHTVRLITPNYLKSFVKRQMNDVADAETVVEAAQWAQTMPSAGPITALATETFAPDLNCFRQGRNFAGWLGLVPKQNATGGKPRLGKTSKMGQRDMHRLLVSGAPLMHVNMHCRAVNGRSSGRRALWNAAQQLVDRHAGAQTPHARRHCIGEQNGPWNMGYGDEARGLPNPCGNDGISAMRRVARPGT